MPGVRCAYVGNFEPEHSTENDILGTIQRMGHVVEPIQEQNRLRWGMLLEEIRQYDLVLWTSTASLRAQMSDLLQWEMLYRAAEAGVPTVGFHLDRWWGLNRWRDIFGNPFFRCAYVFTADGAHQREFAAAGINHTWSPPAIAEHNVGFGEEDLMFRSDIAFVGSWQGGYHSEWQHRYELIQWLNNTFRDKVKFWPRRGEPAIRGRRLADLYASTKVCIGDSCLVPSVNGSPMHSYCSDRVFETIGRGGLLVHPRVDNVTDSLVLEDEHLLCWDVGDWPGLRSQIERALDDAELRERIQRTGQKHVAEHHTYRDRLDVIFDTVLT